MTVTTRETLATTTGCAPCQERANAAAGETFAPEPAPAPAPEMGSPAGTARWAGVLAVEGVLTGDGRLIEPNALTWDTDTASLPLRVVFEDEGAHDGAVIVGLIDSINRGPGGTIHGTGDLDLSTPHGAETARLMGEGRMNGVSVDLDAVSFEVRVAGDLLDQTDLDGDGTPDAETVDEDGRVTVISMNADDEVMVTTAARLRAATLVAIPAFPEARIELDTAPVEGDPPALVAAGSPVHPPTGWFTDPGLSTPTPLTVTRDGRVYGHLATWGTCHIAHGQGGACVTAPRSQSGYAYFHTGAVLTAEGEQVPVGHVTLDTRHAGSSLSPVATLAHYEDTGTVVADVHAGEDQHGVWVAGAVRPGVTAKQLRALRAAPLSGDWRRVSGNLELVAALAVNVPGFPIPRPAGMVASGHMVALVASGVVPPDGTPTGPPPAPAVPSGGVDAAALRNRVHASQLAVRVHRGRG